MTKKTSFPGCSHTHEDIAVGIKITIHPIIALLLFISGMPLWVLVELLGTYQLTAVHGCNINDSCPLYGRKPIIFIWHREMKRQRDELTRDA